MTAFLARAGTFLRVGLLLGVIAVAILVPASVATVEYTAQPKFCNSCHIMEPYYESWENSGHADVSCIECHYEPGTLETVEGKFKALSQLAKYVTRTEGTKPWAEVGDQSCMRSGCHSVRLLEGTIDFGRVKFDHRHHLLESRRGRRLRCTSCHSQIVQGDHLNVTESVCITCHFMPVDGEVPESTSDCHICHGPPVDPIDVAGETFEHMEYLERGVDCRECHDPVLKGDGVVRRDRCHSCHGELGHIERFGETAFLHEMHVTEHKVECFECHDQIEHGLLPLELPTEGRKDGCSSCHLSSHDATGLMLSGTGGVGVDGEPSRMWETRVVCGACHTGRAGKRPKGSATGSPHGGHGSGDGDPHGGLHAPTVARAGAVDCIHCHGPGVAGMLESWQATVGNLLEGLSPELAALEARLPEADDATRELYEAARANVRLVEMDGSRGAHNVGFAVDVLEAAGRSLQAARERLDPEDALGSALAAPFRSEAGCSDCHMGMEHAAPSSLGPTSFSHRLHLEEVGLDCTACHMATEHGAKDHGAPSFPRSSCASCHHTEPEDSAFDPYECADCHQHQVDYVAGELADFEALPGPMVDKECADCHGEPPDVMLPDVMLCGLCHDEEYPELPAAWSAQTHGWTKRLAELLATAPERGVEPAAIERAEAALEAVTSDASGGAHNIDLTERLMEEALESVE